MLASSQVQKFPLLSCYTCLKKFPILDPTRRPKHVVAQLDPSLAQRLRLL